MAHGFAGKRFFPATLVIDDPFVADELSLPTVSYQKSGDQPATRETDFSFDVSKRVTENFGVGFGARYKQLQPDGGETQHGFDNLAASLKYQSARRGLPTEGPWLRQVQETFSRIDARSLGRRYLLFAIPVAGAFALVAWMNWIRYGRATPFYFDHELLAVAWRARMVKWGGMLSYHFLGKNLGIALTSLPWLPPKGEQALFGAPFKINEHGLALWFTTPLYLWLLWPKRFEGEPARKWLYGIVAISAALSATMDLLYQNTGWRQFGYRFSIDYAVLFFVLLAIGARPMRGLFTAAAAWSVAWNLFGAVTFDKGAFDRFYFRDGSQTIVYQPD